MKLLFKSVLLIAVLALLVIMGMNNPDPAKLKMPPIMTTALTQPAAYLYFGFFGLGFVAGAVMMAGGGKKGGSSNSKPAKAK